jgi:hypothetical protein
VIKQGSKFLKNSDGVAISNLIEHEYNVLSRLNRFNGAPKPVKFIEENENI